MEIVQTVSAQIRASWGRGARRTGFCNIDGGVAMKKLDWQPVLLVNAWDLEHGNTHAQLAIDRPLREVILTMDVYDAQTVWDFVRGPLPTEYDARVFDVRDYGGVHARANHTLAIQLAGTLFPVPFFAKESGAVTWVLGNPVVERQRRCDESRLGAMQELKSGGYRAAMLVDDVDESGWPALHVLVDYEAATFASVFEIGDLAQMGAYFNVPVEVVPVNGLFKPELAVQLLSRGFSTLSDDGTRLESFDGSLEDVEHWLGREHPGRRDA
jgi:hypothetical protein